MREANLQTDTKGPEPCENAVSRKAVEEMLQNGFPERGMWEVEDARKTLEAMGMAVDALIDKQAAADRIIDGLPSAQPEPHWIPCGERLPEAEEKIYWVCTDGGYQCQCRWTNINHFWTELTTDWHWHIMDVPQYSKVVAWMPLPEPYKEEQE